MGLSKVKVLGPGKVKLVHQLNNDGTPYAEDVTVEVQPGVDPSRIDFLTKQDGKIGVASFSFSAYDNVDESQMKFPEDE